MVVNARLLSGQLEGLLALSRIMAGQAEDTVFDLVEVARAEVELVDPPATATVHGDTQNHLRAPQDMVRRVINRLVDNALRHSDRSDVTVDVRVADEHDGLVVEVTDDGVGVPEERRARVLEPFARLDPDKAPEPRPGMGLTLCHRTALVLGGDLQIGEGPGGGCRVTVRFPAERVVPAGTHAG